LAQATVRLLQSAIPWARRRGGLLLSAVLLLTPAGNGVATGAPLSGLAGCRFADADLGPYYPQEPLMADAPITDEEISILCDVLEGRGENFSASKKNLLDLLIVKGFVTASDQVSSVNYKLTSKAQQLLAERGVGLSGG
jgi:hypothetical protein